MLSYTLCTSSVSTSAYTDTVLLSIKSLSWIHFELNDWQSGEVGLGVPSLTVDIPDLQGAQHWAQDEGNLLVCHAKSGPTQKWPPRSLIAAKSGLPDHF